MKVEVGLLLPSREALLWGDGNLQLLIDGARAAEAAGYDSVWVGDSLLARPRGEPLTLLAAMAAVTTRVRLGTAVLLPLLRHPLTLAHGLATLDRISRGRVIAGVGPGAELPGTHVELTAVGVPSRRRVAGMMRSVELMRRLWNGQEPGVELLPRPMSPGGPPLWLGAHGPRMLKLAGATFDGWIPFSPTPDAYAAGLAAVRSEAQASGRDPESITPALYMTVALATSADAAGREFDAYIRAYYGVPGEVMARAQASHMGTPESASEWIASYIAAGARHVVLRLARPSLDGYLEEVGRLLEVANAAVA